MDDYFKDEVAYPNICKGEILPYNVKYTEVSSKFLDVFINSCDKHIICYTLDYYREKDKEKEKFIENVNLNKYLEINTNLSKLQDDIVIISEIETGCYMFFWYHLSGRCDIGRFKTDDTYEDIENKLIEWMRILKQESYITDYHKLIANYYLKGYVKF